MNYIDLLVIAIVGYAIFHGYVRGFVLGLFSLLATLASLYFSIAFFPPLAKLLANWFGINPNITPIFAFLGLIILLEIIGGLVIHLVDRSVVKYMYQYKYLRGVDKVLGIIPSTVVAMFFVTLGLLLPVTLPFAPQIRNDIQSSYSGKLLLPQAYDYVPKLEQLTKALPTRSLLYVIPRSPSSEESVELEFPPNITLKVDAASEEQMLELLNRERLMRGLHPLTLRREIVPVARAHSTDMFNRSYFSHINPDGKSPFDRMEAASITYITAGENLAYAPDVEIAHRGLMNSPGHRENILRPEFRQVGIGVIDGGLYGKMFTQNFTD